MRYVEAYGDCYGGGVTDKLTVRDLDERDLEVLRVAARQQGTSLNRYVGEMLHQRAQQERHQQLFAQVAAQQSDLPQFDAVAEVRALRDEKDREDASS